MMRAKMTWPSLSAVYLLFCAPLILAMIYILPPFQAPDEAAHLYRAIQISHGEFAPYIAPTTYRAGAGGPVEDSANKMVNRYCGMPNWSCKLKVRPSLSEILSSNPAGPSGDKRRIVPFSNTVVYLPIAHVVAAVGVAAARAVGTGPLGWLYAGRLANAIFALAVTGLAIRLLEQHASAPLVFVVATLPMVLSITPTLCADSGVISCALLLFALCVRLSESSQAKTDFGAGFYAALLMAVFFAAAAKLAYLPLAVIPLICAIFANRSETVIFGITAIVACATACTIVWTISIHDYVFPISPDMRVNPILQLAYIKGHPFDFVAALVRSIGHQGTSLVTTMVGKELSDRSIILPRPVVYFAIGLLGVSLLRSGAGFRRLPPRALSLLIVLGCATATFAFLYIQNSPVGHSFVEGYQGRYLLPLVPFLAFGMPALSRRLAPSLVGNSIMAAGGALSTVSLALFLTLRSWG